MFSPPWWLAAWMRQKFEDEKELIRLRARVATLEELAYRSVKAMPVLAVMLDKVDLKSSDIARVLEKDLAEALALDGPANAPAGPNGPKKQA